MRKKCHGNFDGRHYSKILLLLLDIMAIFLVHVLTSFFEKKNFQQQIDWWNFTRKFSNRGRGRGGWTMEQAVHMRQWWRLVFSFNDGSIGHFGREKITPKIKMSLGDPGITYLRLFTQRWNFQCKDHHQTSIIKQKRWMSWYGRNWSMNLVMVENHTKVLKCSIITYY